VDMDSFWGIMDTMYSSFWSRRFQAAAGVISAVLFPLT